MPLSSDLLRVAEAIGLAAGSLARRPAELPAQLIGRLSGLGATGLEPLLERARAWNRAPWLCPLTPCLSAPGRAIRGVLAGHAAYINAVAVSADGSRILSTANDGAIRVWDSASGRLIHRLTRHDQYDELLSYSQSSGPWLLDSWHEAVVGPGGELALAVSREEGLMVWDLHRGVPVRSEGSPSQGLAASPDGKWALAGEGDQCVLWDLAAGTAVESRPAPAGKVLALAPAPQGILGLSATGDNAALIWSYRTGEVIGRIPHDQAVLGACFSPDGRFAITGAWDHWVRIWDVAAGIEAGRLPLEHRDPVAPLAVSRDGKWLAIGGAEGQITLYDLASLEVAQVLRGHSGEVSSLAFLPDGRLVSGSHDATVRLWDLTRRVRSARSGHDGRVNAICFAAAGRLAVSAGDDATIRIWDLTVRSGPRERNVLAGHDGPVTALVPIAGSARLLSSSSDRTLRVWDLDSGRCLSTLSGHAGDVTAIAVSPDGRLAASGSRDNTLRLWALEAGSQVQAIDPGSRVRAGATWRGGIGGIAFTPDGRQVVCACHDREVRVWDLARGSWIALLGCGVPLGRRDHFQAITSLCLDPGGGAAIVVAPDETFRIWDLQDPSADQPRHYRHGAVLAVPLPEGNDIITAGSEGAIRILDAETWMAVAELSTDSRITALAVAPDVATVAFGEIGGEVHFLRPIGLPKRGKPQRVRQPRKITPKPPRIGRNDPCPCGSGKKYSRCHGMKS